MEKNLNERLLGSSRAEEKEEEEDTVGKQIWRENKKMWVIAGPAIFKGFSTFGVTVIAQAFIGHIGATELAAFSLVNTLLLRFANGILVCFFLSFHFTVISTVHFSCIPLLDKTQ